jgi:hypothetical protein
MKQQRRIPATLPEFDAHLKNVNNYLHKVNEGTTLMRGIILGMTAEELVTLSHFKQVWTSGDPEHPGVWDLHFDKDKKNVLTRKNVLQVMKDFSEFFRPLLNRMNGSANITITDRQALRIAAPVTKRSRPKLEISEKCWTMAKLIGGSRIRFRCRTTTDSSKPSLPPRADAVEIAYRIDLPYNFDANGKKIPGIIIANAEHGTTKHISTRASFYMEPGLEYLGYKMQFYSRWINIRYPKLNGPWTGPSSIIIG